MEEISGATVPLKKEGSTPLIEISCYGGTISYLLDYIQADSSIVEKSTV